MKILYFSLLFFLTIPLSALAQTCEEGMYDETLLTSYCTLDSGSIEDDFQEPEYLDDWAVSNEIDVILIDDAVYSDEIAISAPIDEYTEVDWYTDDYTMGSEYDDSVPGSIDVFVDDSLYIEIPADELGDEFVAMKPEVVTICYNPRAGETAAHTEDPYTATVQYEYIAQKRILALVPGPAGLEMTKKLRDKMKADPFFSVSQGYADFGVIGVPYTKNRTDLLASVEKSLVGFVDKHGPCVTLDLLGHSLGGFVALAAASRDALKLENGKVLSEVTDKLVTLAGATWGQTPAADAGVNLGAWVPLMADLQPHIADSNAFLTEFRNAYQPRYQGWSKCSLYSSGDTSVVSPYTSGCFSGSPCINIAARARGWVHFLWLIDGTTAEDANDHQRFYSGMKNHCWGAGNAIAAGG